MRRIDMQTWSRRKHFEVYNAFDYPHFGLCANVEIGRFYPVVKRRGLSFTVATVYVLARAANAIPEFRWRIRGNTVVEHEAVHPSPTILTDGGLFSFCTIPYAQDFAEFARRAAERIAYVRAHLTLEDEPGQDDLLFMTGIPWVSFTSMLHPIHMHPADSVPRLAWGKFFTEGEAIKMPLGVQVHHALMDGVHVGRYYAQVQDYLDAPDVVLGVA
jgi:chloramphenicol O-acetyltransferase type A